MKDVQNTTHGGDGSPLIPTQLASEALEGRIWREFKSGEKKFPNAEAINSSINGIANKEEMYDPNLRQTPSGRKGNGESRLSKEGLLLCLDAVQSYHYDETEVSEVLDGLNKPHNTVRMVRDWNEGGGITVSPTPPDPFAVIADEAPFRFALQLREVFEGAAKLAEGVDALAPGQDPTRMDDIILCMEMMTEFRESYERFCEIQSDMSLGNILEPGAGE